MNDYGISDLMWKNFKFKCSLSFTFQKTPIQERNDDIDSWALGKMVIKLDSIHKKRKLLSDDEIFGGLMNPKSDSSDPEYFPSNFKKRQKKTPNKTYGRCKK